MISGIQSNLIEDVKINHCYFATAESLAKSTSDSSDGSDAGWKTIQVPELEDAYPDLSRFGPMPTNGFFLRHVRNIGACRNRVFQPRSATGLLARRRSSRGFLRNHRVTEAELRTSQRL
jgi:hypothetical protein